MQFRLPEALQEFFRNYTGASFHSVEKQPVGGGSINDTFRITINNSRHFFLKVNSASRFPELFEKEKQGLQFLGRQHCIAVPEVLLCHNDDSRQWLLLQWINGGTRTGHFWKAFGKQLAALHQCTNDEHGFASDNYMGALPQSNAFTRHWPRFFWEQRLLPQLAIATDKNVLPKSTTNLLLQLGKKLDNLFNEEPPSLLHGDLWSGNFMCNEQSMPVLIDPAVYYGHRSMDLAMTRLFGGFDQAFYESYHYYFPFPPQYEEQWDICNLYPLLIHLNLFGQGYLGEIENTLKRYA